MTTKSATGSGVAPQHLQPGSVGTLRSRLVDAMTTDNHGTTNQYKKERGRADAFLRLKYQKGDFR